VGSPTGFHSLVSQKKIDLVAPKRVVGFGKDGTSVILSDGTTLEAEAVVLTTGFTSSWNKIFDGRFHIHIFRIMSDQNIRVYYEGSRLRPTLT
jgi:hypothetical protein